MEAYLLNNTGRAKKELIFFNRVPKVGSQTFMEILRLLSLRNQFVFYQDHVQRVETIRLAESEQVNIFISSIVCCWYARTLIIYKYDRVFLWLVNTLLKKKSFIRCIPVSSSPSPPYCFYYYLFLFFDADEKNNNLRRIKRMIIII